MELLSFLLVLSWRCLKAGSNKRVWISGSGFDNSSTTNLDITEDVATCVGFPSDFESSSIPNSSVVVSTVSQAETAVQELDHSFRVTVPINFHSFLMQHHPHWHQQYCTLRAHPRLPPQHFHLAGLARSPRTLHSCSTLIMPLVRNYLIIQLRFQIRRVPRFQLDGVNGSKNSVLVSPEHSDGCQRWISLR